MIQLFGSFSIFVAISVLIAKPIRMVGLLVGEKSRAALGSTSLN